MTLQILINLCIAILYIISTFLLVVNSLGTERIRQISTYFKSTKYIYKLFGFVICLLLFPFAAITLALLLWPFGLCPPPHFWPFLTFFEKYLGIPSEYLWLQILRLSAFVGLITVCNITLLLLIFLERYFVKLVVNKLLGPLYLELGLVLFIIAVILTFVVNFLK